MVPSHQISPCYCYRAHRLFRPLSSRRGVFSSAREALLQRLDGRNYLFTFQTQSLFDASCPGTPHLIYTDHTHLENLKYPVSAAATRFSRAWVELEESAYRNARMVFTMSGNMPRSLVEQYGCSPQKVECVYAGSNVSATEGENIDSGRFAAKKILFVGVDWQRKGGPVLIEAIPRLPPQDCNTRSDPVGSAALPGRGRSRAGFQHVVGPVMPISVPESPSPRRLAYPVPWRSRRLSLTIVCSRLRANRRRKPRRKFSVARRVPKLNV